MGGKSRKTGTVSARLIERLTGKKCGSLSQKREDTSLFSIFEKKEEHSQIEKDLDYEIFGDSREE